MQNISFTLPLDPVVLRSVADMLRRIADDDDESVVVEPETVPLNLDTLDSPPVARGMPGFTPTARRNWRKPDAGNGYAEAIRHSRIRVESELIGGTPETGGKISTFPDLMQLITESGLTTEEINAAVISHGVQSLPLLASKPVSSVRFSPVSSCCWRESGHPTGNRPNRAYRGLKGRFRVRRPLTRRRRRQCAGACQRLNVKQPDPGGG